VITTKVRLSLEMLEAQACDEIDNARRTLIMTPYSPETHATALQLLADMRAQMERRGPLYRATVDAYETALEEWAARA
jgi:hypothetical protein